MKILNVLIDRRDAIKVSVEIRPLNEIRIYHSLFFAYLLFIVYLNYKTSRKQGKAKDFLANSLNSPDFAIPCDLSIFTIHIRFTSSGLEYSKKLALPELWLRLIPNALLIPLL